MINICHSTSTFPSFLRNLSNYCLCSRSSSSSEATLSADVIEAEDSVRYIAFFLATFAFFVTISAMPAQHMRMPHDIPRKDGQSYSAYSLQKIIPQIMPKIR